MKRLPNFLLMMLTTVLLATFIISCSESGSDSDPSTTPTQPQTPVADGDWQVVPATGGTIEKGDITITFPSGTFSGETKVAITEVSRGDALGVDEVSKFYQLTVPARVDKPFTVKIKCAEHGEGINVVAHMPTYQISEGEWTFSNIILPSEYDTGEYSANMPASSSENDISSTISFSLGIARIEYWGQRSNGTRGTRGASVNSKYDEPYTYGNFSWHFIFTNSQLQIWKDYIEENHVKIHSIIREAIKKIHDLGFKVTERDVAVDFKILPPQIFGTMDQNPWKNEKSTVTLSVELLSILSNEDKLRSSAIHEFFHIFQADYDKYARSYTNLNDRQLMYEAGAVWIEQFMNEDGAFSKDFAKEHISWFVKGFNNIDEIHEHDGDIKKDNPSKSQISTRAHASHGYGMSSLFQYLTKKCTKYDINDKKIVELYELWRDKKLLTKDCLEQWTSKKGYNIFQNYNDFFISLFSGKLIPGLDILYFSDNSQKINNYNEKKELSFHCYDYGCDIRYFNYLLTGKEIEKKELVISQEQEDVNTFVFWKVGNNYELVDESPVFINAPEVISGKELYNKYYDEAKGSRFQLYALTTPMRRTTSAKPYNVTSEFRDEKKKDPYFYPDDLTFSAEGGSQTVQIYDADGYKKFGYIISDDAKKWLSGKGLGSGKLQITVQPNTTGKERKSKIACFVCNEEKPTEAQKVYLKDSIKVTQAANKEPEQQESEYELVSGSVNMYYAVVWRWEKSFKLGDDGVTITPNGKGAKVVINQEGTDLTFTWHSTISFEIDDLSLNESNQARISHFRFELEKDVIPYQYYDFHIDSGHELIRMVSPAPKSSYIGGLWTYSKDDLSYYSKSTIHYDKWRKDYYSAYVEHTEESETSEVTDGSSISIGLYINKKK